MVTVGRRSARGWLVLSHTFWVLAGRLEGGSWNHLEKAQSPGLVVQTAFWLEVSPGLHAGRALTACGRYQDMRPEETKPASQPVVPTWEAYRSLRPCFLNLGWCKTTQFREEETLISQ